MRIYLDNCCFNRPFDNQISIRIKLETEAKLYIQEEVINGSIELVWSYILEYENSQNPFEYRRNAINLWKKIATIKIIEDEEILLLAKDLILFGIKSKDALHVACAIKSNCNFFLTTDDLLIKKLSDYNKIKIMNPVEFIMNRG